jgi:hypothetical protein
LADRHESSQTDTLAPVPGGPVGLGVALVVSSWMNENVSLSEPGTPFVESENE